MTPSADIRLRALEPEDLDLLYDVENDDRFWQFGSTTVPYSRYALRNFIEQSQNDLFADGQVRLVIEAAPEEEHAPKWTAVGLADLFNADALHMRAEIGLIVLPAFQGRHYAERALQLLCDYARRLMLHQVSVSNKRASRLFERSGFSPSARLSDWLRTPDGFVDAMIWQKIICPDLHRENCHPESRH